MNIRNRKAHLFIVTFCNGENRASGIVNGFFFFFFGHLPFAKALSGPQSLKLQFFAKHSDLSFCSWISVFCMFEQQSSRSQEQVEHNKLSFLTFGCQFLINTIWTYSCTSRVMKISGNLCKRYFSFTNHLEFIK